MRVGYIYAKMQLCANLHTAAINPKDLHIMSVDCYYSNIKVYYKKDVSE
jgi:hypothetical protein